MVKPETGQANFAEKLRSPSLSANSHGDAVGELQRRLERVGKPCTAVGPHHHAVHHHVDVVLDVLSSVGTSAISWKRPSTFTRWKPFFGVRSRA